MWEALSPQTRHLPLKYLLNNYHDQRGTDVRDRIYALLGLTYDPDSEHPIKVGYSKSAEDVYLDVVQYIFLTRQIGTIKEALSFCNML